MRRALALALIALTLAAAPAAAATQPAFVVALQSDGDARITVVSTVAFEGPAERQAFQNRAENETFRDGTARAFATRLAGVASRTENATGRQMAIGDVSLAFAVEQGGTVGVVRRHATWTNLAAVDGNRLVLTEPFSSGFSVDRPLVVTVPDGYDVDATPAPDEQNATSATWNAGNELERFQVNASQASGGLAGPGFGVLGALVALLGAGFLLGRRRR